MGSWLDPSTVEASLAAMAERKRRGLAPGELKAIKERKAAAKQKQRVGWLYDS